MGRGGTRRHSGDDAGLHQAYLRTSTSSRSATRGCSIAVDHLGLVSGERDEYALRNLDKLLATRALPERRGEGERAAVLHRATRYPYRALHPYLRRVVDAFGPQRVFWGTDLSRLPCSYREAITMWTEEMPWLAAADLESIMGRGVCEWLGWRS